MKFFYVCSLPSDTRYCGAVGRLEMVQLERVSVGKGVARLSAQLLVLIVVGDVLLYGSFVLVLVRVGLFRN